MSTTIKDIAKMANVSTATVSRVLNSPNLVSEEKKELINKIIYELNYQPNALARGLIKKETKTVGVLIPDIDNLFYPAVVRGIEDVLGSKDYNVFICNTDKDVEKEKKYINTLLEKRVDGIIFMGTRPIAPEKNEHIIRLSNKLPVLLINDSIGGTDIYSVLSDEVEGAYKAVKHLLDLGHRKIAYVTGEADYTTYRNKQEGYESALRDYEVSINPLYIVRDLPYPEGGKKAAEKLFDLGENKPSAIFAASDQMAMGVMKAAYERGYRIPEDLSIVGYANIPISADLFPGLTTVDQFPYETGKFASETLTKIISGQELKQNKFIIKPQLVKRQSCTCTGMW